MPSKRIETLMALLRCNNTDIARYAGCSSGHISKLKTGRRTPNPESPTIRRFVYGSYHYAEAEGLLDTLRELCGAEDASEDAVLPALTAWLYGDGEAVLPEAPAPAIEQRRAYRRKRFADRLDRAMTLLELTNGQLATRLGVDVSLISRYRGGYAFPRENPLLAAALSEWLFDLPGDNPSSFAKALLRSLDNFTPGQGVPAAVPEPPEVEECPYYTGTGGLRSAVIRFLTDAARSGGELLLYSDEPMDWMAGDRDYFALWASLMVKCVKSGVRIKIIHNLDRAGRIAGQGSRRYLLSELPIFMMPEPLLTRVLTRANIGEAQKTEALSYYREARKRFSDTLRDGAVDLLLYPPDEDAPHTPRVNFSLDLPELSVEYTPEEYAEHIAAIRVLAGRRPIFI